MTELLFERLVRSAEVVGPAAGPGGLLSGLILGLEHPVIARRIRGILEREMGDVLGVPAELIERELLEHYQELATRHGAEGR